MPAQILFASLLIVAAGLALAILARPYIRAVRLGRVRRNQSPAHWDSILRRRMPYYRAMKPAIRDRLFSQMHVFLHEKEFVGCAGLEITEEMRVVVAAWASLMSLPARVPYPDLHSILIYPDAFLIDHSSSDESGVVTVGRSSVVGESWDRHQVVLSWADIDARRDDCKTNVIVHEFAHQLDALDGSIAGSPPLSSADEHNNWASVFAREYEQLQAAHRSGKRTVLDAYGATEPAEFFAVVAEAFFEDSHSLRREHPEMYETLARYFGLDPCEWAVDSSAGSPERL